MSRLLVAVGLCAALASQLPARAADTPQPTGSAVIVVDPLEGTVGDRIGVELRVETGEGLRFEAPELGPTLGKLSVVEGRWSPPQAGAERLWIWRGEIVAFRPGEQTLPPIKLTLLDADGEAHSLSTEAVTLQIVSVLDEAAAEELADLKAPAQVAADYRTLWIGAAILALGLLLAAIVWWLHRRFASRLAAAEVDRNPFLRIPPHEWVYAELQKLLDRRLAEQGQVELFFAELARIMKIYLGGRYRRELLERTSAEVVPDLTQAGAEQRAIDQISALLEQCDAVKFARLSPAPEVCRDVTEQAYSIVDLTRPQTAAPGNGAAQGGG